VNASASSLDREVEVQSEIQKVRRFSHYARVVCSAIFGFGLIGVGVQLLIATLGLFVPTVHTATTTLAMSPQMKMLETLLTSVMFAVVLAGAYQLYRLFSNLSAGAIYTSENVRRVRRLGLLSLLWAVFAIAIPCALFALDFHEASLPSSLLAFPWPEALNSAVSAGLLLLVSWIMDVGLHTKDHADALQRDAELVI
jgi:hypothetical protein